MRTLVTGGAGFIGSHLIEKLLQRGDEVWVLDDLSTGRRSNIDLFPAVRFFEGSVVDDALVESLVRQCDLVLHLAAAVGVRLILEQPVKTMESNLQGTRAVLNAAAKHGVRVLYASSSEVYGRSEKLPFHEDDSLLLGATSEPRWAYASSKASGEWLALAHARESGLPVTIVRFFNVVGPRQRGRYGMVLPNFVRQACLGEPITVFGDGSQSRCFLHVQDVTRAVLQLCSSAGSLGRVFNIGATREITIGNLACLVRDQLQSSSTIVRLPYREAYGMSMTDLQRRVPDVARLEQEIGFRPERCLEDAIADLAAEIRSPEGARKQPVG
jgi:UDP-glucose 4-epimerase